MTLLGVFFACALLFFFSLLCMAITLLLVRTPEADPLILSVLGFPQAIFSFLICAPPFFLSAPDLSGQGAFVAQMARASVLLAFMMLSLSSITLMMKLLLVVRAAAVRERAEKA